MDFKEFTESDISLVANWNMQLHEDESSTPISRDAVEDRYRRWLRGAKFKGVIILVEAQPVGYIIYEYRAVQPDFRDRESVYIRQFFVAREARRRRFGTTAFLKFLETTVPSGVCVKLNVKASNPSGQLFWESLGFEPENIEYELSKH